MTGPALLWFRQDLRLGDNPALLAAIEGDQPVLPVYVLDRRPGAAACWWLHHSLSALAEALQAKGAPLLLLRGPAETVIPAVADQVGAATVHSSRVYDPDTRRHDDRVQAALAKAGRSLELHGGSLLVEPERLRTGTGKPYSVFTPFSKAVFALGDPPPPIPAPQRLRRLRGAPKGDALAAWDLLPKLDWAKGFAEAWTPGEAGAADRLKAFAGDALAAYAEGRNLPAEDGSSRLSPHLHHGEVSPRQVWHAVRDAQAGRDAEVFLKEIIWRDFSHHLLWHRPEMPDTPLRAEFAAMPWQKDRARLRAWQRGLTGYPIVDAGMRQLWHTGWMHNRVRMIVASLLTKHLLQPWQDGADWFLDTLVDADLANNSANWQWVAGCGADAAPYFRIFNPTLQGRKFDPEGEYVRRWVPEIATLPDKHIHSPSDAPAEVLKHAGISLGKTYPKPVVDHAAGRARALAAYAAIRGGRAEAA